MNIVEKYEKAKQELYNHIGFKEDWVVFPLINCIESYWDYDKYSVYYSDVKKDVMTLNGEHYENEIYTQRFYDKWIYKGKNFTMIFCDPHVDGMKWFRVFDNTKRVRIPDEIKS